jgi:DNA-binding SARP family transcriptional activator
MVRFDSHTSFIQTLGYYHRTGKVSALQALSEIELAVAAGEEVSNVAPYRESGHRQRMHAYAAAGNSAAALRTYDRCRRLLANELGVDPSRRRRASIWPC